MADPDDPDARRQIVNRQPAMLTLSIQISRYEVILPRNRRRYPVPKGGCLVS